MSNTVITDGRTTTIKKDGTQQQINDGEYSAATSQRTTKHNANGIVQSGSSRNVEITGNSQESYAGRGVTCEYSFKVVGTPELFSGKAQRTADKALNKLVGLLLQPGDDRFSLPNAADLLPDFGKVMSKMSSGWTQSLAPTPPQITRIQDIGKLAAYMGTYLSSVSLEQSAYQAAMAAKMEVETQVLQTKENLKRAAKMFKDGEIPESFLTGSPATQDRVATDNLTRQQIYEMYIPFLMQLLAAESQIC